MNAIACFSKEQLLANTKALVRNERRITMEILHHLREIERRRVYLEIGFPSLFEYARRELGYSEGAAYRRISAMRALRDIPEIERAIESGTLSISTVSQAQSFLRAERVRKGKVYTLDERRELFRSIQNLTSREVERELAARSPEAIRHERVRALDREHSELRLVVNQELLTKLNRARDLCSHRLKDPNSYAELLSILADFAISKLDPRAAPKAGERKVPAQASTWAATPEPTPTPTSEPTPSEGTSPVVPTPEPRRPSRYVPARVRRQVWREAKGRCTYRDPVTGRICGSTFKLQVEHLDPYAMGGSSKDPRNLTLHCAAHNQFKAIRQFGKEQRRTPNLRRRKARKRITDRGRVSNGAG